MTSENVKSPDQASLTLAVDEIDLPGTVEGILGVLKRVLSKPYIQSIQLKSEQPIRVEWYKDLSDSLGIGDPEEDPDSVLSRVDLEEFSSPKSPKEVVVESMLKLNNAGLQATHLFVGSVDYFKNWLELPAVVSLPKYGDTDYYNFIGVRVAEVPSLEEDVVVVMGGVAAGVATNEIIKALKVVT
jgi:hypothetical protein